jgi:flagellar assembly protein FliH
MIGEKKFIPLYEIITGKRLDISKFIEGEEEHKEETEFRKEPEEIEVEIPQVEKEEILEFAEEELELKKKFEEEKTEYGIEPEVEIPEIEEPKEQEKKLKLSGFEISDSEYFEEPEHKKIYVEEEIVLDKKEKTEDIFSESEEKKRRKIVEFLSGSSKTVEGEEDIKRRLRISIPKEDISVSQSDIQLKDTEEKSKISSMEAKEKEKFQVSSESQREDVSVGRKPFIHEIIDRIRTDIISRAEVEAKRRLDEAEKKAREIIENAYKEAEKIINEAVSRSIDLSREIEKEAEEKGYKHGFEKGYEEGKEKGYEEGYKKSISEGRYAIEMMRKISDELHYAKERFSDDFPKIVLHLTLVAVKTILMVDAIKDEELVIRVLKDALEKVKDFKIIKIRVNEADLELVKKFAQIPQDVEIIPDKTVERGDVKIEMREGYFESSIKWRQKIIEDVLRSELESLLTQPEQVRVEKQTLKEKFREAVKEEISQMKQETSHDETQSQQTTGTEDNEKVGEKKS